MNLQKTISLLEASEVDGLLLCNEANMHYICGFSPSEGMILITPNGGYHFVDSRYTETAKIHAEKSGLIVEEISGSFIDALKTKIEKHNINKLLFENETISYKLYKRISEELDVQLIELGDGVSKLRNVKELWEIEKIKKANAIAEKSFMQLLENIKPGRTEKDIAAEFDYLMAKNGSDGVSFDTIVLTGAHTSMPHGVPDNRKVKNGDFLLFDFGVTFEGYHSDMTRTVAVGNATQEMRDCYKLVLDAQLAGIKALDAGKKCSEVYKAAYDVLEEKNMGKYFRHSLGHGVGLEIHEGYNASPRSNDTFETGNVTSIEPGIYIPDKFGIRIEDLLYLAPRGRENLSNITKELIIL